MTYHLNLIEIGEIVEEVIRQNDKKRERMSKKYASPPSRRRAERSPSPRKRDNRPIYEYFDKEIYIPDWKSQQVTEDEFRDWIENQYGVTIESISFGSKPDQKWAIIVLSSIYDQQTLMDNSREIVERFNFRNILTISWVLFIDGQLGHPFIGTHILPPLFATLAAICINLVSVHDVAESIKVKVWLFIWVTCQCICVGSAIFILSTDYPIDDNYAGLVILLQAIICMVASFVFFIGRK